MPGFEDDCRWERFFSNLNFLGMYESSFTIKFEVKKGRVSRRTIEIVEMLANALRRRLRGQAIQTDVQIMSNQTIGGQT